jgi:tRNA-specific 2-thiouridylase
MNQYVKGIAGKRVFVGLSGGVDSAVSAALLKDAGAEVVGVFAKGWYPPGMPCTWAEDRHDAMRAAAHLGIPFHTLDASAEYKKGVIDYLLAEYATGRTPNPDAMCNREVKFGALDRFARANGAAFLATGHYARAERAPSGEPVLLRGVDSAKDQSYFLWAVPQETLAHVLFPLGGMEKGETRRIARAKGLPVAEKRDSQGICFLGDVSIEDFLRQEFAPEEGVALDEEGREIGRHDGAILYTIGARAALREAQPGPWYVIAKDMTANAITVSHERKARSQQAVFGDRSGPLGQALVSENGLLAARIPIREANWFAPVPEGELTAQYRYHGPIVRGTLADDRAAFMLNELLEETIAPGQSLVIYDGDRVAGGGIIGE